MRRPRYIIHDAVHRCYLWTKRPAEALRFPGVKSARRMAARLDRGVNCEILNGRGERLK